MPGAILVYGLSIISALCLERHWVLNNLLKRVLCLFAVGAAQLMLSIQLLSLGKWLTGTGLLLGNFLITGAVLVIARSRGVAPDRVSCRILISKSLGGAAALKDPFTMALIGVSLAALLTACLAGWLMIPFGDSYHVEMPLFWIQNHSILPFVVPNPRIVALSFQSEALQLPGFLYAHSPTVAAVIAVSTGLLCFWVIFALARRIGAGLAASACAAAIVTGYSVFALEPLHTGAEAFLVGTWFGGSLLFLMDAGQTSLRANPLPTRAERETTDKDHGKNPKRAFGFTELGCSVFLFLMACGTKNSTLLLAPIYLVFLFLTLRAGLRKTTGSLSPPPQAAQTPQESGVALNPIVPIYKMDWARTVVLTLAVGGLAGLVCSGVAWNYAANKLWFGSSRGPKVVSQTVATDFHPRAIWTRLCRGTVLMVYDTVWVPGSTKNNYAALCSKTVEVLGGEGHLADDDDVHYVFDQKSITPRKGLGLLGILFFIPGVVIAGLRCLRAKTFDGYWRSPERFNTALLVVMAIGSFVLCHLVLRWQSIGMLRIMFPFLIAGAPLTAPLLESRWSKVAALVLLLVSSAMFFTYWLGHVSRRLGWSEHPSLHWIKRLQNEHGMLVRYHWRNQTPSDLTIREDYTYREIYQTLFGGIHQPCTIGFVGHQDSESTFLFGSRFQNRVVPLVDARSPGLLLEPPSDLDYLIAVDRFSTIGDWARDHGYEQLFKAANDKEEMLVIFEKPSKKTASKTTP